MQRWRVPLGFACAALFFLLARPRPLTLIVGAVIALPGLALRAWAVGCLRKNEALATDGPYAYTRNPLYLGSATMALGAAIAMLSWISASLLVLHFAVFYFTVMRREEKELQVRHGAAFQEYARAVPLFLPRLRPSKWPAGSSGAFSFAQYKKNHEWHAALGFLLLLGVLVSIWYFRRAPSL